jgi:hypothetical protein
MTEEKERTSRACATVPWIWLDTIKRWNNGKTHQINVSAVIKKAIETEYENIKSEVGPVNDNLNNDS